MGKAIKHGDDWVSHPDTEQCVKALPEFAANRMARLVLGGWRFENVGQVYPSWKATHPNNWKRLYTASTLLTLLGQMGDVLQDTEAGVFETFDMRGVEYMIARKQPMARAVVVPDAAGDVAALLGALDLDNLPRR